MISVSNNFKKIISLGGGKFYSGFHAVLANGTELDIDGSSILLSSGFEIEDAVSSTDQFQVGAAIINEITLSLYNQDGRFSSYDFSGAVITPWVGLVTKVSWKDGEVIEKLQKGVFTVDEAPTIGTTVSITAEDNMAKFDVAYSKSVLTYPATLGQIAADVCAVCGVALATTTFPNSTYSVAKRPSEDSITCREILSYVAQLAGCFARCNTAGAVEIRWYEEPTDGDLYDVGERASSIACNLADTTITGVQIQGNDGAKTVYTSGTDGFMVRISDNPLAQDNLQSLVDTLGTKFNGFAFRPYELSGPGNPAIEAGDIVNMTDGTGTIHKTLVGRAIYSFGDLEEYGAYAETTATNQSTRFSAAEKAQESADTAQESADAAQADVDEAKTEITQLNGQITLKADKGSLIAEINISPETIKISADKLTLTGLVTISNLENGTTTIDGACIKTGKIISQDDDSSFFVDLDTGELNMKKGTFSGNIDWGSGAIFNMDGITSINAGEIEIRPEGLGTTTVKNIDMVSAIKANGSKGETTGTVLQGADGSRVGLTFTDGVLTDVY